ncbi:LysE family translocator [Rhizomicrobium electricum]|uniref:LysE family transporter n=1 Tax=Rhizomicrobium electricum TaxID=480070 RepID=A0ABP3P253_9PROT|nr:LysE family transporter [Rhizomicrobium electricum]NIJ47222.1 threonine/homoserine/homoserine lactone efflux protein [Rhizomicrobium electricum]
MDYVAIILTGWAIGLIAAVPIGPVNLICIRRTLQFNAFYGFVSGLGASLGDGIFACIAAFSLTAIAQLINGYSVPLQIVGGIMLVVMGIRMFFAAPPERIGDALNTNTAAAPAGCPAAGNGKGPVLKNGNGKNGAAKSPARGMATTFALTTTNPATLLWFFSGAAGLGGLSENLRFFEAAFWVLGVMLGSATWWLMLTTTVGMLHAKIDDHVVQLINRVSGVLVFVFGIAVLVHVAFPKLFSGAPDLPAAAARHATLPIHRSL